MYACARTMHQGEGKSSMSDNSCDLSPGSSGSPGWKKDKTCLVCGDKALGFNFNAVSCESCKAFFRRNAHKTIRGRCQGQCEVTVESRSFCKRCRQQKCFAVGMRKEMILNAEQKKVRKIKIIRNRLRRSGQSEEDFALENLEKELQEEKEEVSKSDQTNTLLTPAVSAPSVGGELAARHATLQKLSDEAIAKLSPSCQALMEELIRAHELALKIPVKTSQKAAPSSATQFFNLAEGSVHRMVKLAKGISAFMGLSKDDQIALLKGAVTEIMMIRSALYFDSKSRNWDLSALGGSSSTEGAEGDVSSSTQTRFIDGTSLNKFGEDTKKMFQEYMKFVCSLSKICCGDLTVIKLLTALALFASDRQDVEQRVVVQRVQESYANLLESYVKERFPDDPTLFPRIVMKLTDMRDITEIHSKMLAKMNVMEVEPLLIEIFDLGQDV